MNVANRKTDPTEGPWYEVDPWATIVNIMRPTPLSNPYKITGKIDRASAVKKYRSWLFQELRRTDSPAHTEFRRLLDILVEEGSLILECCCSPEECHGDVLKTALMWAELQGRQGWYQALMMPKKGGDA